MKFINKAWHLTSLSCILVAPRVDCDWEDGMCGWHQDTDDDFNWIRSRKADTHNHKTGPDVDHTLGDGENSHLPSLTDLILYGSKISGSK